MRKFVLPVLAALVITGCGAGDVASNLTPQVYAQNAGFSYEDFTQEKYDALKGSEAFAVFFHSKSCGTCVGKDKEIKSEVQDFTDGTILKLEYSDAPAALKKELGVTGYDTFTVFNADGTFTTQKGYKVDALKTSIQDGKSAAPVAEKSASVLDVFPTVLAQNEDFTYEDFTQERYDALKGSEAFAVFFHSKSCGTCVGKDKEIKSEVQDFTDGTILKLEYDKAPQALKKELGVVKYDTFTVFKADGSFTTERGYKVDSLKADIQ